MMLAYHDQWDKILVTMTNVARIPPDKHRDLARSYTSRKSVTPVRNRILVYPDSDKEDEEYCMDITNYEDSYHEDAELPDLPIFSATNEFASVSQQVEKILILALQRKKEEVPMEDVEMDENHDIDHSGSHNKEMEFEVCSLETFTRLHSSTRATVWFKRLVSYAKGNLDYYDNDKTQGLLWWILIYELVVNGDGKISKLAQMDDRVESYLKNMKVKSIMIKD
ncbi:hypothetical protein Tco_0867284 [Tanacetum coccineum]